MPDLVCSILTQVYTPFSYEDFAVNPETWMMKIYDFIGIPAHVDIHGYLEAITKSELGELSQYSKLTHFIDYSTIRNPKKRAFDWVNKLSWRIIDKVQMHCQPVFEGFGYFLGGSIFLHA